MAVELMRRLTRGPVPLVFLLGLLLLSFWFLSDATENSERFGDLYGWMVLINVAALLVLVTLIGINLFRLMRQHRIGAPGSRLTLRLVLMFVILSVLPVSVVYYFSLQFLQRGIDSWFDVRMENALKDALELSQVSLELRKRELLRQTAEAAEQLMDVSETSAALTLNDLRSQANANELVLLGQDGRIIAFSSGTDPSEQDNPSLVVVPRSLSDEALMHARRTEPYLSLEPNQSGGLHVRIAYPIERGGAEQESRILTALYSIPPRLSTLADSVQDNFASYQTLAYLRKPLKNTFSLTLSLVLLLSLLAAVWAAFFSARRLVQPVRDLAEGTRAVADGDYNKQLPMYSHDELGFLVQSFNDMTRRIARASDEAQASQQQAEEQRAYLEAVLAHLSSGVITLDADYCLRTANAAAGVILDVDLGDWIGKPLQDLAKQHGHLHRFTETLTPHLSGSDMDWIEELILFGNAGRKVLICRGTVFRSEQGRLGEQVIVFDDITALVQAQRDAAWGEVARRLAHEIKNPLTPIQLSAERLRHKYLKQMQGPDAELLDRSTHTIVTQVEAMKEMVNAFSEYAKAPQIKMERVDLNGLIREVVDLYKGDRKHIKIALDLDNNNPGIEADAGRLRQLLHNLIKNAQEAMESQVPAKLEISSRCMEEHGCRYVEVVLRDYGGGFPDETVGRFFEPYVTTKVKGTGLGLAIVKKIVEEHGGMIRAENCNAPQASGARIIIRLPVLSINAADDDLQPPLGEQA